MIQSVWISLLAPHWSSTLERMICTMYQFIKVLLYAYIQYILLINQWTMYVSCRKTVAVLHMAFETENGKAFLFWLGLEIKSSLNNLKCFWLWFVYIYRYMKLIAMYCVTINRSWPTWQRPDSWSNARFG